MNGSWSHYPRGRAGGWAWPATGVISIFRQSIMRGRPVIPRLYWVMKILCKIEMSFRQNKEASICSAELFWVLTAYSLCRFSKAGNKDRTLWPTERLTNFRLLKSWAGGMEVISFNYSVFVSYLTNVYGVGDWSDQIKKFQITLTRNSPVGRAGRLKARPRAAPTSFKYGANTSSVRGGHGD